MSRWPGAFITMPAVWDSTFRGIQSFNRAVKWAAVKTMKLHHKKRIPKHFTQQARHRYGYQERRPGYKAKKKADVGSITDLKYSGESSAVLSRRYKRIRVGTGAYQFGGNKGAAGMVDVTMELRWPFPVSNDNEDPTAVTIRQMGEEVSSWTEEEARKAGAEFLNFFMHAYAQEVAGIKMTRKVRG